MASPLDPLGEVTIDPEVVSLPKADIHLHQEWFARLDRVLARREGRAPYDWHEWVRQLMASASPGVERLERLANTIPVPKELDDAPENFVARIEDLLEESAADGAILTEMRFGGETLLRPDCLELFREAERRVRSRHPGFHAATVNCLLLWYKPERLERVVEACIRLAGDGLGGVDLLYDPYVWEAEWGAAYQLAERLAGAGLGITVHAGEFSTANLEAALRVPGVTRLGHAVYAASDPRLLELVAESGVTVECSLSCNVVLGAVPSYEEHPIRRFVEHGIPVALCTDDPVQVCTTIGREYAIAHRLGFSPTELLGFTANAIRAAFIPDDRRAELLADLSTG